MISANLKVLIIEDDRNLAEAVANILLAHEDQSFEPDIAYDGKAGLEKILHTEYDCILLDRMLPGYNGIDICKELKEKSVTTPIIMVTARSSIGDRIEGLEAGADDYLPKPFSPKELIARIKAVVRRTGGNPISTKSKYGDLVYNSEIGELSCGSERVILSTKENDLMYELMKKPGEACTKEELLRTVWQDDDNADANNVEAYVSFLRKKLKFIGTSVQIKTLRRIGYRIEIA